MHDAYERFMAKSDADRKVILYLGDHDPSGLDMIRDVRERLAEFGTDVEIIPVAITKEQIERYQPPPNPAKIKDPRAGWYIREYGRTSWEVDALNPDVLHELLEGAIHSLLDADVYREVLEREEKEKEELRKLISKYKNKEGVNHE